MNAPHHQTPSESGASEKQTLDDLAIFGGAPVVESVRSASNLVQPSTTRFYAYLRRAFDDRQWLNGPNVQELERRLAKTHDVRHCITFCNGLWAIVVCLDCVRLRGRSEVVMPSLTYRRLGDIAAWTGLTPHFCDVSAETLAATDASVEACINDRTAALLIAHPIVNVCDVEAIERVAKRHGIPLVFDAVEAAHATRSGRMLGAFGDAECYSMHASKFLNAFEGGYITTNNDRLAAELRRRRDGDTPADGGEMKSLRGAARRGFQGPLHEAHAALALASLDDLNCQIERNRNRHAIYARCLTDVEGMELIPYASDERRTFKNTLVRLRSTWPLPRDATVRLMHAENLLVRPYYSPPLHQKRTSYETIHQNLPNTEMLSEQFMLLPSGEFLQDDEIVRISQLAKFLGTHGREILARLECHVQKASMIDSGPSKKLDNIAGSMSPNGRRDWDAVRAAFDGIFRRRYYTNHGPLVQRLEQDVQEMTNVSHAIAVANLSTGLVVALKAMGFQELEAATHCGASGRDALLFDTRITEALRWAGIAIDAAVDTGCHGELTGQSTLLGDLPKPAPSGVELFQRPKTGTLRVAHWPPAAAVTGGLGVGDALVMDVSPEHRDASVILTNDPLVAAKVRNMRSSYGAGKATPVPLTGNARMSEAQAALAILDLHASPSL